MSSQEITSEQRELLEALISLAIREDIGDGDHSSIGSIPSDLIGNAQLLVKAEGVLAGVELANMVNQRIDHRLEMAVNIADGEWVEPGAVAFELNGPVRSILQSERLILNFMQRMSGIATYTKRLVDKVSHTNAKLLDTRKTTPGLRVFEKWAVRIGGGQNHRFGLYDMVMLKDNHIDYAGGITRAVDSCRSYLASSGKNLKIEVETRDLSEVEECLRLGVDRIMFDNFSPEEMHKAVAMVAGQTETEASGGITEESITSYAETGVDYISVGALTHSVKSLDLSLKEC